MIKLLWGIGEGKGRICPMIELPRGIRFAGFTYNLENDFKAVICLSKQL